MERPPEIQNSIFNGDKEHLRKAGIKGNRASLITKHGNKALKEMHEEDELTDEKMIKEAEELALERRDDLLD